MPTRRLALATLAASLAACGSPPPAARAGSAGPGVQVITPPFSLPGLGRTRTVRLWLPPGYEAGTRRYPVLYMHDGQNLFDAATSGFGEWGVDEVLAGLGPASPLQAIVVGIDHGGEHRLTELNPFDHPRFGPGEGEAYLGFIVGVLKPWVDARWRTLPGPAHTAIVGSSMGGLISHYAIHRHPGVFGRAGVLSPAYWTAPAMADYARAHPLPPGHRIHFAAGDSEGDGMLPELQRLHALLVAQRPEPGAITLHIAPGGKHHEATWHAALPGLLAALLAP